MAKGTKHIIKVGSVYFKGGYSVKCEACGPLGRSNNSNKKKAKAQAWEMGSKHRASANNVKWFKKD